MRVIITILLALMLGCFSLVSEVGAYPYIEVSGAVDPYSGGITDNLDGTTTLGMVGYYFTVTAADFGAEMDFLSLEFESDVFSSAGAISGIDPADWDTTLMSSPSGSVYQIASAGTTLGAGYALTFSMLDVIVFNEALLDSSLWQEGTIWAQSFTASDTLDGYDGGSTALTPEPGTMLLMGSGLFSAGYYIRRKKHKGK